MNEITHFEFSQHAVALQRIRTFVIFPAQMFSHNTRYPDMGHVRKSVEQSTRDCAHFKSVYTTY